MSQKFIRRSRATAARLLGGEMMIMSVVDSTFFTLNEVATVIWQAADGTTSLDAIVERICDQFDVDPEQAEQDVEHFVDALSKHGILMVSEAPMADSAPVLQRGCESACPDEPGGAGPGHSHQCSSGHHLPLQRTLRPQIFTSAPWRRAR